MIGIVKQTINNIDKDFFAIENLNRLVNTTTNACLFCNSVNNNFILPVQTNIFLRAQSHYFNGILITDDLELGTSLISTTYATKRFIYLYHLDWVLADSLLFSHLQKLFLNDHIDLIARSESHAKLITDMFKQPKFIMSEWNFNTLIEIDNHE